LKHGFETSVHFFFFDEFAAVRRRKTFIYTGKKPGIFILGSERSTGICS
jgi:hypothetical protein